MNGDVVEHVSKFLNYSDSLKIYKAYDMAIPRSVYKKLNDDVVKILIEEFRLKSAWKKCFSNSIQMIDEINDNYWSFDPSIDLDIHYVVNASFNFLGWDENIPNFSDYSSEED